MSHTPAAELARLKVTYQNWSIQRGPEGSGFTAERRDGRGGLRSIYAPTLGELEHKLAMERREGTLRDSGLLSEAEFAEQKARLLGS
jgi:hypothetical protein